MKKVLVTASTFPRWDKDTEPRFVLDLSKALSDCFDVTVMAPAYPGAKDTEILEGIKIIRYHYFPIHSLETLCYPGAIFPRIREKKVRILLVPFLFLGLWMALLKNIKNYDIVHAHWIIPQGIVQSCFNKPYIVTGHGGDVCSLNKGIIRQLKIKCLKKASAVTVVSEHLKGKIEELVPNIHANVISMGVDTTSFGPEYRVDNYFGQGDKKVVLFVGRLAEVKGVKYLIEAMQGIDAVLVIAGDGPQRKELEAQAYEQSLQKNEYIDCFVNTYVEKKDNEKRIEGKRYGNIIFLGSKTHEELRTIYASADIFCMPSVTASDGGQEGFGLVMLEAMASGLPIVASRSGGIPQLIIDGENGLLCEEKNVWQLSDNITTLLDDLVIYKKLTNAGCATVNAFSYKTISEKYERILRGII